MQTNWASIAFNYTGSVIVIYQAFISFFRRIIGVALTYTGEHKQALERRACDVRCWLTIVLNEFSIVVNLNQTLTGICECRDLELIWSACDKADGNARLRRHLVHKCSVVIILTLQLELKYWNLSSLTETKLHCICFNLCRLYDLYSNRFWLWYLSLMMLRVTAITISTTTTTTNGIIKTKLHARSSLSRQLQI